MSFYRAPNRRLIARAGSGRFRETTLADIGMACCSRCGALFTPEQPEEDGPVNPRVWRERRMVCEGCRVKATE